ncbi:MAG: polysaccharide deacetylase family protein [bacterium]
MKKPRVSYESKWEQKKLKPPPGGSLIVFPVVNVEHWVFTERMPRVVLPPPQGDEAIPDVPNWSWKEYGWRRGLPRIMDVLGHFGVRATAAINGDVCNAYPGMARAMDDAGWEFMGHGFVQTPMTAVADERQVIADTKATIEDFTKKKMRGWMGPGLRQTFDTADLLKEAGVDWTCDWAVDDLPVEVQTKHGPLVGVPYTFELNDIVVYAIEHHSSPEMYRRLRESLPVYLEEIKQNPSVLVISVHPYVSGVPHRIGWYRRIFQELAGIPEAVFMTGSEIADWYLSQT